MSIARDASYSRLRARPWHLCACALLFTAAIVGCTESPPEVSQVGKSGGETTSTSYKGLAADTAILDVDGSKESAARTLAGFVVPTRTRTDALRTVVLSEVPDGLDSLSGQAVLDAQFVDDGAVVLGADHVLRHYTPTGERELASDVLGPLSTAAGRVAFVHGMPPDLRLAVIDLEAGETRALASELTTVWSPALSPDGREVIVAASEDGRPQLFRVDPTGNVHTLADFGAIPSSPTAPIWRDGRLTFEDDELGVVQFDLVRHEVIAQHPEATLLPDDGSGRLWLSVDGRVRTLGGE